MLSEKDLHGYQKTGVDHILGNSHCALFLEMGLGKTVTTLTSINHLMFNELSIDRVLVIAPKRVAENVWHTECRKWAHLQHLEVSVITGNAKQRRAALNAPAHIYTIGRDNVSWLCGQYGGSMLPFDMLVIDELSSFKNPKSVRFKALKGVQPCFSRVVGLTGTPAPNGLIDIWSQIYLLDRGKRLGKFVTRYREDFFTPGASKGHVVYKYLLKKGGEAEIHRRISDICLSMKAKDYLDLPERIENNVSIAFPENIQKQYDDFEREMMLELFFDGAEKKYPTEEDPMFGVSEGPNITAVNAAALSNKLLQFANGAVYDDEKNWHVVHDLKIEAVKEILETSDSPVLIGWTYRHDMHRLMEALKKYKPRELKTGEDIDAWNRGEVPVMLMHPASGGHGLNLQAGGNNIIWFGQTWSLELYQQFNARLDRQGQTKPVIIHKLIAEKTIDQDVVKAQKNKTRNQDALMEAVKSRIKKYFVEN